MPLIFSFISYVGVHALSWLIGAWQVKLARYCIVAVLGGVGILGVKAYWQWGLVSAAKIEAATGAAKNQARLDAGQIVREREALLEAQRRAEDQEAARQEEARRAPQPNAADPVLLPAGDSWLRGESQAPARRH